MKDPFYKHLNDLKYKYILRKIFFIYYLYIYICPDVRMWNSVKCFIYGQKLPKQKDLRLVRLAFIYDILLYAYKVVWNLMIMQIMEIKSWTNHLCDVKVYDHPVCTIYYIPSRTKIVDLEVQTPDEDVRRQWLK